MSLTLVRGPPRIMGLRRKDCQLVSLHGKSKPAPERAISEDIYAPPESTDDESSVKKEEDDIQSDDTMPEARVSKRKLSFDSGPVKSTNSIPTKGEDDGLPPSSIPGSTFLVHRGGSRGSQKRGREDLENEDDAMNAWGSQPRKPKNIYGGLSQRPGVVNIHLTGSIDGSKKSTEKNTSPKAKMDGRQFRKPDISWKDSIGRKQEADNKKKEFKKPSSNETTPRSRRGSQRSLKSTQGSQDTPTKVFKQPRKLSPKKVVTSKAPIFKTVSIGGEETGVRRVTRSSEPRTKPFEPTNPNALGTFEIHKSANVAASKLGLSDLQLKPPSLSIETALEPSKSFEAATSTSSPLSSVPEELAAPDGEEKVRMITSEDLVIFRHSNHPSCPFCKESVDKDFLEEHVNMKKRLSIRQQVQFCKAHKKRAAEDEWKRRQYPTIDWPNLNRKLNGFHAALDGILQKKESSFYRNAFEDVVKARKNKTSKTVREDLLDASRIEELMPGYYGSRGARMMTENIMSKFTSKIRRLAASDDLISSGGVSEFVQAVLVPEMAVLLVKADMHIEDEEKAREVLRSSVDIGHMLNEEEDEVIKDPNPEELEAMEMTRV